MAGRQNWNYRLVNACTEHQKQPVYCVSFNLIDPAHRRLFASCGGRQAMIYECQEDGLIEPLQGFKDTDEAEEFYTVKWTIQESTGTLLLLVGGKQGVVRVLDCSKQTLLWTAVGHGQAVNDICVHPQKPDLFLTASKDCSLRLWNLKSQTCVLVATGAGCHTNEVLSIDFHPTDMFRFVSSGMDDTIKIWWLKGNEKDIEASYKYDASSGQSFVVGHLASPIFSTRKDVPFFKQRIAKRVVWQVHWNYVDCVRWMGDLVLSKSVDSRVLMWKPMPDDTRSPTNSSGPRYDLRGRVSLVQEFYMQDADIWFMRFSTDPQCRLLACGSRLGKVFVWDLLAPSDQACKAKAVMNVAGKSKCTVRQTAVSWNGSTILACCDDGSISRFEAVSE